MFGSRHVSIAVLIFLSVLVFYQAIYNLRIFLHDYSRSEWRQFSNKTSSVASSSVENHYGSRQAKGSQFTSIVIFKLPRSGSSWLTDNLNIYPSVFIMKEIIQQKDHNENTKEEMEDFIIQALQSPRDKISSKDSWLPTSRFYFDALQHLKPWRHLDVVGFTINPEHCPGVDWGRILSSVESSRLKVVVLVRRSLIRVAVSEYLGTEVKAHCGDSNLRSSVSASSWSALGGARCQLYREARLKQLSGHRREQKEGMNASRGWEDVTGGVGGSVIRWNATEFIARINFWQERYRKLLDFVAALNTSAVEVTYEGLRHDGEHAFENFFKTIDVTVSTEPFYWYGGRSSMWQKRSYADLRDEFHHSTLAMLTDPSKGILSHSSCACLRDQFEVEEENMAMGDGLCLKRIVSSQTEYLCVS